MSNVNKTCWNEKLQREKDCVPAYGLDRVWAKSSSKVTFMNSFKMKLSIILGVTHMILGIFMKGVNNIYFGSYVEFIFEFIPQIVFMCCTFGYMCVCIVVKWVQTWEGRNPPSVINLFINLVTSVSISTLETLF